ncbi:GNAT family N-acetyltransferase [Streptomyces sp. NPDC021093]|uniref:GNAT family N-acetyltransferase n=1 Tax=Streptomyces sp. NPDC021093 TaxID=3365112 RepID=UPI003793C6EB
MASTPGIRLRPMTLADCGAVAACRVLGWQHAYGGQVPQSYLDAMNIPDDTEIRRKHFTTAGPDVINLVAERTGRVVGWACFGPYRETEGAEPHSTPDRPTAELYTLYVHPDHLSTGTGRALLAECAGRARTAGFAAMSIWVLSTNDRARRFYERAGFTCDGTEEPFELGGATLHDVRYTSLPSAAAAAAPSLGWSSAASSTSVARTSRS